MAPARMRDTDRKRRDDVALGMTSVVKTLAAVARTRARPIAKRDDPDGLPHAAASVLVPSSTRQRCHTKNATARTTRPRTTNPASVKPFDQLVPARAEAVAGRRHGRRVHGRADEAEDREREDRHLPDAGHERDERPDERQDPADADRQVAPPGEEPVGPVEVRRGDEEELAVPVDQGPARRSDRPCSRSSIRGTRRRCPTPMTAARLKWPSAARAPPNPKVISEGNGTQIASTSASTKIAA